MRIDKLLAHSGFGSRKEVKELIKKGIVIVNGEKIKKDKIHVDPMRDEIWVDDQQIIYEEHVYYMLNKPAGYVSATEDKLYPTVVELIDDYYRDDLFPVGRLDVDTEGLLIMTNDGVLAHQLLSPKKHCPKVYYAKIKGVVNENDIQKFLKGIVINDDYQCQSAHLKIISTTSTESEIEVEIYEGKFHQVKKMFLAVGKEVTYLKRIRMKDLELDNSLELGAYRRLTDEELDRLKDESVLQ
ncbi:pseudouridine synthase [Candidatus Stoquefichus massiliensis]|uniref:pseudouridine synthase n=1 Tax=Candidatus Stoquefichus massiliensis TaxID=1470350 RepID=UPI000486770D|nr:pseudouridine synthase [Candidatus Stoquefichus massiliensis]